MCRPSSSAMGSVSPPVSGSSSIQSLFAYRSVIADDPWRDATTSADGVIPPHIPQSHIGLHDGFHTSDLLTRNDVDATVVDVQQKGLAFIKETLSAWKPPKARRGWREATVKREA